MTWLPATPFVHVLVPVLRNESVTVVVAAACIAPVGVCETHAECKPLSVGAIAVVPPPEMVDPVLKFHSLVTMTEPTLMSKRT